MTIWSWMKCDSRVARAFRSDASRSASSWSNAARPAATSMVGSLFTADETPKRPLLLVRERWRWEAPLLFSQDPAGEDVDPGGGGDLLHVRGPRASLEPDDGVGP